MLPYFHYGFKYSRKYRPRSLSELFEFICDSLPKLFVKYKYVKYEYVSSQQYRL